MTVTYQRFPAAPEGFPALDKPNAAMGPYTTLRGALAAFDRRFPGYVVEHWPAEGCTRLRARRGAGPFTVFGEIA